MSLLTFSESTRRGDRTFSLSLACAKKRIVILSAVFRSNRNSLLYLKDSPRRAFFSPIAVRARIGRSRLFDEIDFGATAGSSFRTIAPFRNRGENVPCGRQVCLPPSRYEVSYLCRPSSPTWSKRHVFLEDRIPPRVGDQRTARRLIRSIFISFSSRDKTAQKSSQSCVAVSCELGNRVKRSRAKRLSGISRHDQFFIIRFAISSWRAWKTLRVLLRDPASSSFFRSFVTSISQVSSPLSLSLPPPYRPFGS